MGMLTPMEFSRLSVTSLMDSDSVLRIPVSLSPQSMTALPQNSTPNLWLPPPSTLHLWWPLSSPESLPLPLKIPLRSPPPRPNMPLPTPLLQSVPLTPLLLMVTLPSLPPPPPSSITHPSDPPSPSPLSLPTTVLVMVSVWDMVFFLPPLWLNLFSLFHAARCAC